MRSLLVLVTLVFSLAIGVPRTFAQILHVEVTWAIHPDVSPYISGDTVSTRLENASAAYQYLALHTECVDYSACVGISASHSNIYFGSSGDYHDEVETKGEADDILAHPSWRDIGVKVVKVLIIDGVAAYGYTEKGRQNSLITYDARTSTYAHEFGHMRGVADDNSCKYYIMNNSPLIDKEARDTISQAQRDSVVYGYAVNQAGGIVEETCPIIAAALSELTAVSEADGVHIAFSTDWEERTESFEVYRVTERGDSVLYSIGEPVRASEGTGTAYEAVDPSGGLGDAYRIVEHQSPGYADLPAGPLFAHEAVPIYGSEASTFSADSLAAVLDSRYGAETGGYNPCSQAAPAYALIYWGGPGGEAERYAKVWQDRGIDMRAISRAAADSCFGGVREYIRWAAASNTKYVLLMGDANDHAWWDDPARWTNGWQFPAWHYPSYQHFPSQPENDLLPTYYYGVGTTPATSWSYFTPYFSSDLPYADLDGDELPDIPVGRIPCGADGTDALAYAAKLSSWLGSTNNHIGNDVCLLTYARNINSSKAWPVRMFADSLTSHMPPGVDLRRITVLPWDPRVSDDQARVQSYDVAGDGTDVLVWATNWADRNTYGRIWSIGDGWSVGMLPITSKPFISLGLSCGFNNFDQTEHCDQTVWDPGVNGWICVGRVRPVVERLLFDPRRGAIAQVGPTRGSYALGNQFMGEEILRHMYSTGTSLGQAFVYAQRACMIKYPQYRDFFKSYVLLGDPLLGGGSEPTAVDATRRGLDFRLEAPWPNPAARGTTVRYALGRASLVSVRVYDVQGRLVRSLFQRERQEAGVHVVSWDAKTSHGVKAKSGVYFITVSTGEESRTRKVVIVN